jgi:Flp pilus assembly protein TadB
MFKVISFLMKTIPAFYYTFQLNVFVRDAFRSIEQQWLINLFIYGVPSALILGGILYFLLFRDALIRQKAKESDEDESRLYTVGIQSKRMVRKYFPLGVLGMIAFLVYWFYKPILVALVIRIVIIYVWFLLGEMFRILSIAREENKRSKKALG